MQRWNIENEDVLKWAARYNGSPFHSMLCDPPYHLTNAQRPLMGRDGQYRDRQAKGFMGKDWDGGNIAFRPETWAALSAHLHPGAFIMAFASSRGWHRQAVAMEDAGLIMHPTLFGWSFGSGFPKATRVKEAPAFEGRRYGLQAVKPAVEPILVFQKPYSGRPVDCITRTGAGALNIDGGRIESTDGQLAEKYASVRSAGPRENNIYGQDSRQRSECATEPHPGGRWPSNLILMDQGAVAALDRQSGDSRSSSASGVNRSNGVLKYSGSNGRPSHGAYERETDAEGYSDYGGASRFFFQVENQIDSADPIRYVAKADRSERDAGLDHLPVRSRVFNGQSDQPAGCAPGSVEDKFSTSPARNSHPTVKPLSLTKYLATLLLPPDTYAPRRILIPFGGVCSEAIGALKAGWDEIVIIEREAEYAEIGEARMKYWNEQHEGSLFAGLEATT